MARAEYEALSAQADERVSRMATYRDEGNTVRNPDIFIETSDYGRKPRDSQGPIRHRIQLPLGKALTVKHAYRIAGQLPDIVVDQREETPREQHRSDTMEKIAWSIMRRSKAETTLAAASWNASELGAACLDIYWDIKGQIPAFRSVDPMGVFEVQGSDDPHDFQRVYRVWDVPLTSLRMDYEGKEFRGQPVAVQNLSAYVNFDGVDMCRIVQMCDREKLVRFAACGQGQLVGLYEVRHNYGFVPYVIIPNLGPYDEVWGWADYEFVRQLSQYIGVEFSREADVIKAVAGGAYIEKGTGVASATLSKIIRDGGVASVRRDSEVEPIQAPQMPAFAEAHADRAMNLLKMLGFAPDAAWGLPGSGSGTDRGLQLQPLLEYTAMKQLNWTAGLARLFGMGMQMVEKKMVGKATYSGAKPGKAGRSIPFAVNIGPTAAPTSVAVDSGNPLDPAAVVELPNSPKELFDGDYTLRFVWRNRVDPEDPQYVMSELNKFQQGVQSLETTLENLGVQAPEDEMRRIEKEAERFPWVNQGLVSLLMAQLKGNGQGEGGGPAVDQSAILGGAMDSMTGLGGGASGALNTDAGASALGPDAVGVPYGGA